MNESLKNKGDDFLFENIEFLSKVRDEFSNERDILKYIKDIGISNQWICEIDTSNRLLLSNNKSPEKKNLLICSSIETFDRMSDDYMEPRKKDIVVNDNKIYSQETVLKAKNIVNISKILNFIERKIETNFSWELLESEYNISILISINDDKYEELENIDSDIIICFDGDKSNLLEITQTDNLVFNMQKNITLSNTKNSNNYELKIEVIFKENNINKIEKERFNSIKINLDVINELKKHISIDIIDIYNKSKINDKKYDSKILFSSSEEDIDSLIKTIKVYNEKLKETIIDNSIGIRFELRKLKDNNSYSIITEDCIKSLSNVFESVDYIISEEMIINLAEINTQNKNLEIKGIVKLNNANEKINIQDRLIEISNKYDLDINFLNEIPLWGIDRKNYLRNIAIKSYRKNNLKTNKIVAVTNSKYINIHSKQNNSISYIYKITNDECDREYVKISDIVKSWTCIGNILDELIPNDIKVEYCTKYRDEIKDNYDE